MRGEAANAARARGPSAAIATPSGGSGGALPGAGAAVWLRLSRSRQRAAAASHRKNRHPVRGPRTWRTSAQTRARTAAAAPCPARRWQAPGAQRAGGQAPRLPVVRGAAARAPRTVERPGAGHADPGAVVEDRDRLRRVAEPRGEAGDPPRGGRRRPAQDRIGRKVDADRRGREGVEQRRPARHPQARLASVPPFQPGARRVLSRRRHDAHTEIAVRIGEQRLGGPHYALDRRLPGIERDRELRHRAPPGRAARPESRLGDEVGELARLAVHVPPLPVPAL